MNATTRLRIALALTALATAPAFGALGGDVATVESDRARLQGVTRVTAVAGVTVHEIQTPAGLLVREYATAGKVFAVSWRGPGIPDLNQLLGTYSAAFQQASPAAAHNRHHLAAQTPEVVVESHGQLRTFFGRAWAPALLPTNFDTAAIK
ncbi:MAG: hypothetical protein PVSMB6_08900 [Steroidobacteraceae bacterium]